MEIIYIMKELKFTYKIAAMILLMFGVIACDDIFEVGTIDDPNNATQSQFLNNPNKSQLQNLVSGLEFRNRAYATGAGGSVTLFSTFGREVYPLFASDPRFITNWMGTNASSDAENDPGFFGAANAFNPFFDAVKQANFLMEAVANSEQITEQERNGYLGFAKTIQAFNFLMPLLAQLDNGIRFDLEDPLNPGPFVGFEEGLQRIMGLLDEAQGNLNNAGSSFPFNLQPGFSDFNTPATFIALNRALKARTAVFAEDWNLVLQSVQQSAPFFELAEGEEIMNKGAYHNYGAPPDLFNPFFFPRNAATSQIPMVHSSLPANAEDGDLRVENKFFLRENPVSFQGFSSLYQDNRFETNEEPFPFFRNEELILLYAEANAQLNNLEDAVDAINLVRNTWNLPDFNSSDQQEIIDQILFERQYSLWFELGHRWLDLRRYNLLDETVLAIDAEFDPTQNTQVYSKFARPLSESQFDDFFGN